MNGNNIQIIPGKMYNFATKRSTVPVTVVQTSNLGMLAEVRFASGRKCWLPSTCLTTRR